MLSRAKTIDHLKQVRNSCWDMISQELINGAAGQWSKRLSLVVYWHGVNSVICACCKLFLPLIALKMLSVLMFSE